VAKPWDVPPLPRNGDADQQKTYAHAGFIMSRWASLEFELSRLHSLFMGALDEIGAMRAYEGATFLSRADKLRTAADSHFRAQPSQKREGEFHALMQEAAGYAARRNDIAHGLVMRIDEITVFRQHLKPQLLKREHYALIAPLYASKAHRPDGLPAYAYTSASMERLANRMMRLQQRIRSLHAGPKLGT
jgi:hypothetical protein